MGRASGTSLCPQAAAGTGTAPARARHMPQCPSIIQARSWDREQDERRCQLRAMGTGSRAAGSSALPRGSGPGAASEAPRDRQRWRGPREARVPASAWPGGKCCQVPKVFAFASVPRRSVLRALFCVLWELTICKDMLLG